jgi:membrane protein
LDVTDPQRHNGADDRLVAGNDLAVASDDERKPDSPTDLSGRSWSYAFKQAWAEFRRDECTDLAAGLTYYAVLSLVRDG